MDKVDAGAGLGVGIVFKIELGWIVGAATCSVFKVADGTSNLFTSGYVQVYTFFYIINSYINNFHSEY